MTENLRFDGKVVVTGAEGESSSDAQMAIMDIEQGSEPKNTSRRIRTNPTSATNSPEVAIGHVLPDVKFEYKPRDCMIYALGIGMGTQHKDFLRFLYEMSGDFTVFPTYGAVIGQSGMTGLVGGNLPVHIDLTQTLHGEQYTELLQPLGTDETFTNKARVVDVMDKGRGAVFVVDVDTYNSAGEKVLHNQSSSYVQGMGGYGGKRASTVAVAPQDHPKRKPDASIQEKTSVDQAALYRLSKDYSPLHIDPDYAAMGGFDRPILHGLCSFGYSGRHVLQQYCDNDPSKFKAIKVRFSKPVLPDQALRTDMWKEGSRIHFTTTVVETGALSLTGAYVDLVDAGSPASQIFQPDVPLQSDLIFAGIADELSRRPDLLKKVKAILTVHITDSSGKTVKTWTADVKNAPGSVYNGAPQKDKADVTITVSDQVFLDVAAGKTSTEEAFFAGKMKVQGNIMLGPKLHDLFKKELSKL